MLEAVAAWKRISLPRAVVAPVLFLVWASILFAAYYPRLWRYLDPGDLVGRLLVGQPWIGAITTLPLLGLGIALGGVYISGFVVRRLTWRPTQVMLAASPIVLVVLVVVAVLPGARRLGMSLLLLLLGAVFCWAAGNRTLRVAGVPTASYLEHWLFSVGLGLGALVLTVTLLAFLGLLYAESLVAIALVALLWLRRDLQTESGSLKSEFRLRLRLVFGSGTAWLDRLLLFVLAFLGAISLIGAVAPETGSDAVAHHLAYAGLFAQEHRFVDLTSTHYHAGLPSGASALFAAVALFADLSYAKFIQFGAAILLSLFVYLLAARYGSHRAGLVGALMFWATPLVAWEATTAYVDLIWSVFVVMSFCAILRWWEQGRGGWFLIAWLAAGLSLNIKYQGLLVFVVLGVVVVARMLRHVRSPGWPGFRSLAKCGLLGGALGSVWLVKNWVLAGNPVFPIPQLPLCQSLLPAHQHPARPRQLWPGPRSGAPTRSRTLGCHHVRRSFQW